MQNPSFQKVWDIAYDFVRKLPSDLCDELHESLNRGVDVLDSEPLLQMYIYSFGKMHNAKLQYAFEHLQENVVKYKEIEIVDYGCGQGMATICYHDFLLEHNPDQTIKRITLIEPSSMALSRAELLCSRFFPNAEIVAINKQFDELTKTDLIISSKTPTLHLFSNILDVESYDLSHFSLLVKEQSAGDNEYILVSPMQNAQRVQRLKAFATVIDKTVYFEQYLDKRQFDEEKDWTCVVILCSDSIKRNVIELDCDRVFEETKSFSESKDIDLNIEYLKELFYKLQVCARFGDKRCQNQLGIWYKNGIGTKQNIELAYEWFKKASEQGYVSAYKNIVLLYNLDAFDEKGKSFEMVYEFFKNATQKGDAEDKFFFALCYYYGVGVDVNDELAFYWFNEAAKQGNDNAINALGICYFKGEGIEKNMEKAILSFTKAAQMGNITSIKYIIKLFKKGKGIEYFCDEQYDIFVKATQINVESISDITQYWSNIDIDYTEDSDGVRYSNDWKKLLCTNMYFNPDK